MNYLLHGISDHTPLVVSTRDATKGGGRPFKFFNKLVEHPKFYELVGQQWKSTPVAISFYEVMGKLNKVKSKLKDLHATEFANIGDRIKYWQDQLRYAQETLAVDPQNYEAQQSEFQASREYKHWSDI